MAEPPNPAFPTNQPQALFGTRLLTSSTVRAICPQKAFFCVARCATLYQSEKYCLGRVIPNVRPNQWDHFCLGGMNESSAFTHCVRIRGRSPGGPEQRFHREDDKSWTRRGPHRQRHSEPARKVFFDA